MFVGPDAVAWKSLQPHSRNELLFLHQGLSIFTNKQFTEKRIFLFAFLEISAYACGDLEYICVAEAFLKIGGMSRQCG